MTILSVKDLNKSYRQGSREIHVLKGLDLEVEKGETVAILGRSGSGKSTFLSLLSGLDGPETGDITIAGSSISQMNEAELASFRGEHVGIIFQQFHLMDHLTAIENVSLPLEILGDKEAESKAQQALEKVELGDRYDHYPNQLSGGENQRVAIARAFVTNPNLLIADEPSGNLDEETGDKVMDILFKQVEENKMTMVLVTHNQTLAAKCKKVLRLDKGILVNSH